MGDEDFSFLASLKQRRSTQNRFSLLHLSHNEYLLQDYAVFRYIVSERTMSWVRCHGTQVGGRLKLASKGLVFMPTSDKTAPIVRYPFSAMQGDVGEFNLPPGSEMTTGVESAHLFSFVTDSAIDLDTITCDSAIAFDIDYDSAIAYSNCTSPFRGESPYYLASMLPRKQSSAACEPHLQRTPRHSHHLLLQ